MYFKVKTEGIVLRKTMVFHCFYFYFYFYFCLRNVTRNRRRVTVLRVYACVISCVLGIVSFALPLCSRVRGRPCN